MRIYQSVLLLGMVFFLAVGCGSAETPTTTDATTEPTESPPSPTPQPAPTTTDEPTPIPPTDTPDPTPTPAEEVEVEVEENMATLNGFWAGSIEIAGISLGIELEFSEENGAVSGIINIPDQGAVGLPLTILALDLPESAQFEIDGLGAEFDGELIDDTIVGTFSQNGATGEFSVELGETAETVEADSAETVPYLVEEVSWLVDDIAVNATWTQPEGNGPFPAIIFIAGSGPTDRNWNSPLADGTNGSAALLADRLTRAGYVTLRYDKRVAGPTAMANLAALTGNVSMQSHQDELVGGVELLASSVAVDASAIYALGNSEGTLHALNYQTSSPEIPFAGLILTAPPGRPLQDVIRGQIEAQVGTTLDPAYTMELYDEAIGDFLSGNDDVMPSPDLPEGISALILGFANPVNLPFTRELLLASPAELLPLVEVPVLVLIGQKDIQVSYELDGGAFEEVAGDNVRFVYPENANHVLKFEEKSAETLTPADGLTYNLADKILDDESISNILQWLSGR